MSRSERFSADRVGEILGTNWLNKLGVLILVGGVALFIGYKLQTLGAGGKDFVGFLVAAAMLGAGVYFERRDQWRILARAGIGGGWALAFFTVYAMRHLEAARVLASNSSDIILLLVAGAGMVAHTLKYRCQTVTGLALLLAFLTVNANRGDLSEGVSVFLFALAIAEWSFRLTGLGLLLLCVGKIAVFDFWEMTTPDKILTAIVIGSALYGVSYLYTRNRERLRQYL